MPLSVIKVAIAGDQFLVRAGLRWTLEREPGIVVVGELDQTRRLDTVGDLLPHVVVIHLEGDGACVSANLLQAPKTDRIPILLLTGRPPNLSLANDVDCHLSADVPRNRLVNAVKELAHTSGRRQLPPDQEPLQELTERERQVLDLIAAGHTNKEMASQLVLSVRTIETHRSRIRRKLRAKSRADLVQALSNR